MLLMLRACRSVLPVRSPLRLPESAENVLFPGALPLASAGVGGYRCDVLRRYGCDAWLFCCLVRVLSRFDRLNNHARAVVWSSIRSGRRLVWPTTNCTTCEDDWRCTLLPLVELLANQTKSVFVKGQRWIQNKFDFVKTRSVVRTFHMSARQQSTSACVILHAIPPIFGLTDWKTSQNRCAVFHSIWPFFGLTDYQLRCIKLSSDVRWWHGRGWICSHLDQQRLVVWCLATSARE